MDYQSLLIDNKDGIVIITINRPKALNAINVSVMRELSHFFSEGYKILQELKGVILTGAGEKAFVAGADIKEFLDLNTKKGRELSKFGQDVYFDIERFHVPVIAAVNGYALGGGCELAMACHMRVAGPNARFGQPEVNLGLVPGYGGTQRLIQLIGKGKAIELLLTADMIGAEEALRLGLVNHVTESGQETDKAAEIINKISTKGPLAIAKCIECVNTYFDKEKDGFRKEYRSFGETIGSEDSTEGAQAFIEKRKADFKGR